MPGVVLGDRPHVLHFFCHGTVQYGGGSLSLATIADRAEGPDGPESVSVDIYRLRKLVSDRMLWLVTLNCCSGAQSTGKTQSLAQVVVEAGAGAALGWRTPVAPEDAHVLCRTVYSGLLRLVPSGTGVQGSLRVTDDAGVAVVGVRQLVREGLVPDVRPGLR